MRSWEIEKKLSMLPLTCYCSINSIILINLMNLINQSTKETVLTIGKKIRR